VALFGLIKKAFYARGIWEALGYMLWHSYTTENTLNNRNWKTQPLITENILISDFLVGFLNGWLEQQKPV
jgi:hypothetical protein